MLRVTIYQSETEKPYKVVQTMTPSGSAPAPILWFLMLFPSILSRVLLFTFTYSYPTLDTTTKRQILFFHHHCYLKTISSTYPNPITHRLSQYTQIRSFLLFSPICGLFGFFFQLLTKILDLSVPLTRIPEYSCKTWAHSPLPVWIKNFLVFHCKTSKI